MNPSSNLTAMTKCKDFLHPLFIDLNSNPYIWFDVATLG